MSLELHLSHTIRIELPNGEHIMDKQLAVSQWHAVEKSMTKYMHLQSNRSKYTWLKPLFKVR